MPRKLIVFFVGLMILAFGVFVLVTKSRDSHSLSSNCPFCNSEVLSTQKFYEDDLVLALYTHKPVFPGHCLIIPKKHLERFEMVSDEEAMRISQIIKKVNQAVSKVFSTSAYLLLQKNGREVGQSVPHVHFHYIPRREGDDSIIKFVLRMFLINAQKPIKSHEMNDAVIKMKEAMDEVQISR
jgi:diadenosine tetraphosphate (Ap4A) HIT family hydrolase